MAICIVLSVANKLEISTAEVFPNCTQYALTTSAELVSLQQTASMNAFLVDWQIVSVAFGSTFTFFVAGLSVGLIAAMLRRLR